MSAYEWVWEDERVTLKCEVQGNPSPSFRWLKDGSELRKSKDVKIKTNKKHSKVQISQVRLEDSGNYTCVAENSLGKDNSTSYISVQSKAEKLYQKRVLTITGICVALLVVGIVCVVAYCKTKKQRKKMQNHLHQNMYVEHPNRMLANGPNHPGPGPGPEEIPMVDYISKNAPATERVIRHGTETSGNFSGSRMSSRSHHSSTATHASSHRHEERTWSMERSDSMNSNCHSGALSSSVGTSKCSSPACMARHAAHCGYSEPARSPLQYGDSFDSLRDSPHSDRYVSALTTPARLSPVDFHFSSLPQQVPTFQITTPNASHALSLPPAVGSYSPGDDQPLLRRPRRTHNPYHSERTGSLPSSPYRLADDEDYETTQEYMSSRERPKKSGSGRRWHRRSRLNGHVSHRAKGPRDYSSQSCLSDSEWEEDEDMGELGHGESTPFLSMQNMSMNNEPATIYRPNDMRTYSSTAQSTSRSNTHTNKFSQSRSKPDNAPL
ncbi:Pro-neuregulin-2, membrane-bound isoform [Bagarius yarrelli]|uniref:Pro-neuregulin-2, membrane-bound isoform n=1 Tax=Bagarius yarrelli TaxID=175774 RepID=A0A556TNN9_BAGYA|nr:Pro-neuregulin-2, membrane-bound isoform [Bagarius yarrelli]